MKIIEKIRKLITHAESARSIGNVQEAEAFAEKIQELLDSHNLSLSDIEIEAEQLSFNRIFSGIKASFFWQKKFVINIAELQGCQIVFCGSEITVIGTENDRLIVIEIYRYFEKLGQDFAHSELQNWKNTAEYKRKRKKIFHSKLFKKSFFHGFFLTLIRRFREKHEADKQASSNTTALIFIGNKLAKADQWILTNLKTNRTSLPVVKSSKLKTDAFFKGVKAGESVTLTTKTID